jgi:hypothetical protein
VSAGPAGAMTAAEASAVLMVPHRPGRTPRPSKGESQLSSSQTARTACAVHPSRVMCRRPSDGMFAGISWSRPWILWNWRRDRRPAHSPGTGSVRDRRGPGSVGRMISQPRARPRPSANNDPQHHPRG